MYTIIPPSYSTECSCVWPSSPKTIHFISWTFSQCLIAWIFRSLGNMSWICSVLENTGAFWFAGGSWFGRRTLDTLHMLARKCVTYNLYFSHSKNHICLFLQTVFLCSFEDRFVKLCHDLCRWCDRLNFLQPNFESCLWKPWLTDSIFMVSIKLNSLLKPLLSDVSQ